MKVSADLELCQAHQMCQLEAPAVFGFDVEADKVAVLDDRPGDDQQDDVRRAVRYCPTMALTIDLTREE